MRIEKHITLEAAPAKVYNALTLGQEITQWFCDMANFNLDKESRVYFAWKKEDGETFHPKRLECEINDFTHCKELDMHCRYGAEESEVKFLLRPDGLRTELTVIQEGIQDIERLTRNDYYWDENLKKLKNYIEHL